MATAFHLLDGGGGGDVNDVVFFSPLLFNRRVVGAITASFTLHLLDAPDQNPSDLIFLFLCPSFLLAFLVVFFVVIFSFFFLLRFIFNYSSVHCSLFRWLIGRIESSE